MFDNDGKWKLSSVTNRNFRLFDKMLLTFPAQFVFETHIFQSDIDFPESRKVVLLNATNFSSF